MKTIDTLIDVAAELFLWTSVIATVCGLIAKFVL